ncbi:RNA 2',3'-cyclic phosphodiesterase [Maricaulis sp. D1M11]|uniref:RNA 2',3'-cyclic phosphodiesterase n=1 Tax=Maricaulis sp. D1M11 TaxID=3076117 RepID=UPI0039B5D6D6
MTLRLFAALPLPEDLARRLKTLQKGVPGARWRPVENFHLTLRFFGEMDERRAEDLDGELAHLTAKRFDLALKGTGWFGKTQPHALWLGAQGGDRLTALQEKTERAARKAGLDPETRKFAPHVTLAYLQGTPLEKLIAYQKRLADFETDRFPVTHFSLYASWPRRGDANIYECLADYPLI